MSDYINLFVLSNCILHFPIKIVIGFLPARNKQLRILSSKDYYCLKYENYTNHMFAKKILFVKYYSHKNLFEEKLSFTLLKRLKF